MKRHGKQSGTRQMIDLLKLSQKHGREKLQKAVETALSSSCYDSAAVQHLLSSEDLRHAACEAIDVGALRGWPTQARQLSRGERERCHPGTVFR
jgi:hypothetical protein